MADFMRDYEQTFSTPVCIPDFEINKPFTTGSVSGDVGLELEIEGTNLASQGALEKVRGAKLKAYWVAKNDGSLRGEALEYVLSTPCFIDEVSDMVSGLYNRFAELGTTLTLSNRCSTHVHVNMVGKKINEITSAIALWTAFEEPLTNWAGEERVNNHFCLSAKDCNRGTVQAWNTFISTGSTRFGDNLKYSALNILTLHSLGSIEFRVMNASEDPERIIDWTKFIYSMTRYAGEKFNNPRHLMSALSEQGGKAVFRDICERANVSPAFIYSVEDTVPDMDRAVLEGFRRAQPIVAGHDWDRWMPEIAKEYVENPFGKKKDRVPIGVGRLEAIRLEDFVIPVLAPNDGRPVIDQGMRRVMEAGLVARARNAMNNPAAPPLPDFVPVYFEYQHDTDRWVCPDIAQQFRRISLENRRRPVAVVDFSVYQEGPVSTSRPIEFSNGTPAKLISISNDGSSISVIAIGNLSAISGESPGLEAYYYSTATGRYLGGANHSPKIRNV